MLLELYFEYLRGGDMDKETIKTCGRLLAEYEGVRRAAGGDANGQSQYYSMVVNNPARGLAMVEKRTSSGCAARSVGWPTYSKSV